MRMRNKTSMRLLLISMTICLVIFNRVFLIVIEDFHDEWKRFTFKDGVMLYNICQKNEFKEDILKQVYWDKTTDFREFLLSK